MISKIINLLKHNPLIWKLAKNLTYFLLALKAWLLVTRHNLQIALGSAMGVTTEKRVIPLVVSFTSYGHRIAEAHVTVMSLLRQQLKPDRVILWLGHGEKITPKLEKLCNRGLEIRFCEDIRAYTKIIPTLVNYPEAMAVTVDDDIIYPANWLKKLYTEHLKDPRSICCHRAHLITKTSDGKVRPYNDWLWCITVAEQTTPKLVFPTGVGGVLYPPGSLDSEVTNVAAFKELCPHADDIWLKAMSLKKGTLCRIVSPKPQRILTSTPNTQKNSALRQINIDGGQNDIQFKNVFAHYDLYKFLD